MFKIKSVINNKMSRTPIIDSLMTMDITLQLQLVVLGRQNLSS
jgi:hypothetical protein